VIEQQLRSANLSALELQNFLASCCLKLVRFFHCYGRREKAEPVDDAITASKAQAIVQNVQSLVLPLKAIQQLVFGDDQWRGHVQVRRPEQPHQPIFGIGLVSWSKQ
jgi:hypothetical protein